MKLSIVTITRDDPEGLANTLASADRLRAHDGVQHIVVDGSRPAIAGEVERAAAAHGVAYVASEPAGISAAFNEGLARAAGDWVWYLNGGDTVEPDLDVPMLLSLLGQSSAEVAIFRVRMPEGPARMDRPPLYFLWPPVLNWIPHPATIVRRAALSKIGGFSGDYRLAMDGEFWIRLLGDGATADIIPLTISAFAPGGASSDVRAVAGEVERLIWQHKRLLFRRWLQQGYRVLQAWYSSRKLARNG